MLDALRSAFAGESPDQAPFDLVRRTLPKLVSRFERKESIVVDRLMRREGFSALKSEM
jgi:hypothetical protein